MIKNNLHKYSISAMCKVLQIQRSTYYYEAKERASEDDLTSTIIKIFQNSRQNYGTSKIKVELKKLGHQISRRRIGRIFNREIVGFSTGPNKDAALVYRAFSSIKKDLRKI